MGEHPDLKLLATETPQEQVDRMGNGWWHQDQYDKQLELPVHMLDPAIRIETVERDGQKRQQGVWYTNCGIELGGDSTIRSTDDTDDVTCKACG